MTASNKVLAWYTVISIIIIIILACIVFKQNVKIVNQKGQILAITDTVHHYITKDQKNGAYIKTITGSRDELLTISKQKDKTIYDLMLKNKNITDVTRVQNTTSIDTTAKNDITYIGKINANHDTVAVKPDSIYIAKKITDPWYTADIKIINDSARLKLTVINKFNLTHEYKSNGFLKPKSLIVNVVNENPYTRTDSLSSYQFAAPKSKLLPAFLGGAVATGVVLFLLKH